MFTGFYFFTSSFPWNLFNLFYELFAGKILQSCYDFQFPNWGIFHFIYTNPLSFAKQESMAMFFNSSLRSMFFRCLFTVSG